MIHASIPHALRLPADLSLLLLSAALEMSKHAAQAFRVPAQRSRRGRTLRPGKDTPLWNELRQQLRVHLQRHGDQVNLGRVLGLPRQRIHSYIIRGDQMPDAERALQLLAWLIAANSGQRPA